MAIVEALVPTGYVPPQSYIGQLVRPSLSDPPALRRVPCIVGKGSRLAKLNNTAIRRSKVTDEELSFTPVAPYRATLQFPSDQAIARTAITASNGVVLSASKWRFIDASTIEVSVQHYDPALTYTITYQSTGRDVVDPLPVADLRGACTIGAVPNQADYVEGENFRLPVTFRAVEATLESSSAVFGSIATDLAGAGVISFSETNSFSHEYTRSYTFVCTNAAGAGNTREATFRWSSRPVSGGVDSLPHVPLNPAVTGEWPTFTLDVSDNGNSEDFADVEIELGILLDISLDGDNFTAGDSFTFTVYGAPKLEIDPRHTADNQHFDFGTLTGAEGNTGEGTVTVNPWLSTFTGSAHTYLKLECTAAASGPPKTATIMWSLWGHESIIGAGTISVSSADENADGIIRKTITVPNSLGSLKLDFKQNGGNFDDGDTFTATIRPERLDVSIRDDREYDLQVTQVSDAGEVIGTFVTNTQEGSFGDFTATSGSYVNITDSTTGLPGGLRLRMLNLSGDPETTLYAANDTFTFSIELNDTIDWSLTQRASETIAAADIKFDANGRVTGTSRSYYVVLTRAPSSILYATRDIAGNDDRPVTVTQVGSTAYVSFGSTLPATDVTIVYDWIGPEPAPGVDYYLSSAYLRTDDLYNDPILVRSEAEAKRLLAPLTLDNDVLIGALCALSAGAPGVYVVQVGDDNDDGEYHISDYATALAATDTVSAISDLVVVNYWSAVGNTLSAVDRMADPFARKFRHAWFGMPVDSPVGDDTTAGSLVYTAQNTLQVYGESQSHGTRVLVSPTWVKKTLSLEGGTTVQATLDGSFMAAWLAGRNASFPRPAMTLLKTLCTGFDEIHVHSEADRMVLGAARVIWFTQVGTGVYRIEENNTVDSYAPDSSYVEAMNQKWFMVKLALSEVDKGIGSILPSADQAAEEIKDLISGACKYAANNGLVGAYQDDSGKPRAFNKDKDTIVFADTQRKGVVHFKFGFFLQYTTKYAFGQFATDGQPLK